MAVGQYSGLPTGLLFRHLFPLLAGLGLAIPLMAILRAMLDLGVLMWSGRGLFHLFSYQTVTEGFFTRDILAKEVSSLKELGDLNHQLLLVLGIAAITTFVCVVASTKSVGKACMVAVPAAFMLLVSLTIRACLAPGAPNAVLRLLTPDWEALTRPSTWLEATAHAVFSLQLGLGAFSTFASYSRFSSNLVRDTAIMTVAHLVWVLLSTVLTFSLIGLAQLSSYPPINGLTPALVPATVDTGIWLAAATLLEKAFATLSYGWLWAGLYFILIILVGVTSLFGYVEVVTSSLFILKPSMGRFKPLIAFLVLALLFLADLILATQGGIHIYHLLISYIASWPALLFSLLTVLATLLCHGIGHLMRDVADMARLRLHHWVTSHLATIYYTILPIALTVSPYMHFRTYKITSCPSNRVHMERLINISGMHNLAAAQTPGPPSPLSPSLGVPPTLLPCSPPSCSCPPGSIPATDLAQTRGPFQHGHTLFLLLHPSWISP